ncbi:interaptin isoform X2 [Pseudochaenichthys georgianus]|uniref:interaptin isoform X2 n=1 Tax=Pseudochaenichthys georgianus TaxID=52239 RepID=UPI00146A4996|nr:interaptin isoform X1 [Pseudochaenichthys georgianus]
MRMQGKANRDPQKKSMGEKAQHIQQPEDEKKAVQKRTFTRWMNGFLQRREPPIEVYDLFTDIQDGRILMALLEELSGCQLLYRFRSSSHRIFRLNNISKALTFLDDRHVKLLGIDASGIADGIPSVVLNLVWNMILYFQVQEVTAGLQRHLSSSLSSLSMSSYPSSSDLSPPPNDISSYFCSTLPSKCKKAAKQLKYHGKAIKTLLRWVQRCTSKFGVEVHDFGRSWRSGLAFLAMIKSINTALVDLRASLSREPRENIKLAFMVAHHNLYIPPLLEPEDVSGTSPDEQSIITYVSMFLRFCPDKDEDDTTDMEVPDIPHFGSLESVSIGETLADDPDAQALLQGMKKSSEQLLWRRWARRSQGSPCATSLHTTETTSPFNQSKSRSRSILQPPSPLDAGVANQDIRSWMEKAPADQEYSKPRVDESHFSLSSEEGIYSLSALDSDEEDAYSYILDLNKEVFQPYNQIQKQVPRVEEETEEEMFLNGEHAESKHLEECEILNGSGCTHQEDSLVQHVASEVRDQSVVHRTFDRDTNERSSTEVADSRAAFDIEPKEDSREEQEDERVVRGQSNAAGDDSEEEREKTGKARFDKRHALIDESKNTRVFEAARWNREVEEDTEKGLFEKCRQMRKKVLESEEEEHGATFEERQQGEERVEEDNVKEEKRGKWGGSAKVGEHGNIITDKAVNETTTNSKEEHYGKDNAQKINNVSSKEENKAQYNDEVMNPMDFEEVKTAELNDRDIKTEKCKLAVIKATAGDHPDKTASEDNTNGGVNVHPASSATSWLFGERGFLFQSPAAFCGITPLELDMLLLLWILLYCCFILPQMNF